MWGGGGGEICTAQYFSHLLSRATRFPLKNNIINTMDSTNKTTKNTADKQTASLKQILESSKLTNIKILPQELPSIERGLNQIDSQSQKLSAKTATSDEKTDIRAYVVCSMIKILQY